MKQVSYLNPFGRFCCTIGNLPTSYMESLTYEQQLLWFLKFLDEQVIPANNANADAIVELQNYLKNLNLQDYVNNKLDEMAESGELTEIIAQYLQLAGLLCFNTKPEMKSAQNLVDGSFVKTFGTTTYNDGYGYFYKIREILNTDVIDDDNLIALSNYPTLLAEKIPDSNITTINSTLTSLQSQINIINNKEIIIVGDSYLAGQSLTNPSTENFGYLLMQKMNIPSNKYHLWGEGGSSFTTQGNQGHNWLQLIQAKASEVTPANITDLFFIGGYNDVNAANPSQIETAMSNTISGAITLFPNAKIYVCLIGNNASDISEQVANRNLLKNRIYNVYKDCTKYNAIFLPKGQLPLQDYTLFENNATAVHPNADGHSALADWLFELINYGDCDFSKQHNAFNLTVSSIGTGDVIMREEIRNNDVNIYVYGTLALTTPITNNIGDIDFGEQSNIHFMKYINTNSGNNQSSYTVVNGIINTTSNDAVPMFINFRINPSGHLVMHYYIPDVSTSIKSIVFNWQKFINSVFGC